MFKAISAAALFALAAPALAIADAPLPSRVVRYADLDLSRAAGARELERRIAVAARQVCASKVKHLGGLQRERQCRRDTVARAVRQVQLARAEALSASGG